jgi:hypothetical protein
MKELVLENKSIFAECKVPSSCLEEEAEEIWILYHGIEYIGIVSFSLDYLEVWPRRLFKSADYRSDHTAQLNAEFSLFALTCPGSLLPKRPNWDKFLAISQ